MSYYETMEDFFNEEPETPSVPPCADTSDEFCDYFLTDQPMTDEEIEMVDRYEAQEAAENDQPYNPNDFAHLNFKW